MNKFDNRLFFFVGNSGSGKDSLMKATMEILERKGYSTLIVKRYITRHSHKSEKYFSVSKQEFLKLKDQDKFSLDWHIYDLYYGCPRFEQHLKEGKIVFVNVSRSILSTCKAKYPHSHIVYVKVPDAVAESRLLNRGREQGKALKKRLQRMKKHIEIPFPVIEIQNNCKLKLAATKLATKIESTI